MTKDELIAKLEEKPREIYNAEMQLLKALSELEQVQKALADKRSDLLLANKIDGKNAEMRAAQLDLATRTEREEVALREQIVAQRKAELNLCRNEFVALGLVARMLAGEVE